VRARVEGSDAGDEIRTVGEVQIIHTRRDARFDDAIGSRTIGLERPARIDEDIGTK
jgi:hypothetical protein